MYDYLYDNANAQGGFDLQDLPKSARVNPAEAFAIGYGSTFSESSYGASQLINTQYSNNRRKAAELALDLPEIRTTDGNYVSGEEFSLFFSGEKNAVSRESIDAYETKMKALTEAHPDAGFKSLRSIWDTTRNTAQTFSRSAEEERMGVAGGAAYLLGSMAAFGADPINAATLAISAAPVAGVRTLGTVGRAVVAEGAIQAGVETVQEVRGGAAMRERLGLDGSFASSAQRVGGAALFGGAFRGASEALMAGAGRALGREIGLAPAREVDDSVPQSLWGEAITGKREVPSRADIHVEETTKLNALAEHIEPRAKDSPVVAARVLEDLEAVRVQADDWSAPPLWSKEFEDVVLFGQRGGDVDPSQSVDLIARQIDSGTFRRFDALAEEGIALRAALAEAKTQGATDATFTDTIADLSDQIQEATDALGNRRLPKNQRAEIEARRAELQKQRDEVAATPRGRDTPEQAELRRRFVEVEQAMRDFAPNVSRAYAKARGEVVASKETNSAVAQMIREGRAELKAEPSQRSTKSSGSTEAPLRARAGAAVPEAKETMADTVVRVTKQEADALEADLESFVTSLSRALDGKGELVLGNNKIDLDTTIDVPFDDAEGFKQITVREFIEQARMADDSEKAMKTCLI